VSAGWVNKLGQEGEEEEGGLGIKDVDDNALREDAGEGGARCVWGSVEGFVAAEFLDAEIDEISGTEVFDDAEGAGGRDEQGGKPGGGGGGVDQCAYADAER